MSEVFTSHANTPRYQGFLAPDYPVQFLDDQRNPVNLTGVDPVAGMTFSLVSMDSPSTLIVGTGDWSINNAASGLATYSFGLDDLSTIGSFAVYVTVQLPGESTPRAFDFDIIVVAPWNGEAFMTTQVNLTQVNSAAVSPSNAVPVSGPVTIADGAAVTIGSKADGSYAGGGGAISLVGLLRGIFDQVKVPATLRTLVAFYNPNSPSNFQTNNNTDTALTFGANGNTPILGALLQNNTGNNINFAIDKPAGVGTYVLQNNQFAYMDVNAQILAIHVLTSSAQNVNATNTSGGLYIEAWG